MLRPESFTVAGKLIRATYRRPGGRVYGYIVTTPDRKLIAHVHATGNYRGAYDRAEARRAAVRFAKGRPFLRDRDASSGPCWRERPERYQPWLRFIGRWPVVARYSRTRGLMMFHPATGLPPFDRRAGRRRPSRTAFVEVELATAKGEPIIATVPARRVPVYVRPGAAVALTDGPSDYGVVESVHKDRCVILATTGDRVEQLWGEVTPILAAPDPSYVF
jgi:hypothetical protein